jgi:hypothetical protein
MISVQKINDEVLVWCSKGEKIDAKKIKNIIATIKRIHRNINKPCNIVIKSVDDINFNLKGELFYNKLLKSKIIVGNKITINYEN